MLYILIKISTVQGLSPYQHVLYNHSVTPSCLNFPLTDRFQQYLIQFAIIFPCHSLDYSCPSGLLHGIPSLVSQWKQCMWVQHSRAGVTCSGVKDVVARVAWTNEDVTCATLLEHIYVQEIQVWQSRSGHIPHRQETRPPAAVTEHGKGQQKTYFTQSLFDSCWINILLKTILVNCMTKRWWVLPSILMSSEHQEGNDGRHNMNEQYGEESPKKYPLP